MSRVLSISSSRADVGILAPVWRLLADSADHELHVLLTGMHAPNDEAARAEVPEGTTVHTGGADISGTGGSPGAAAMASICKEAGRVCAVVEPDLVIIIGDRLDMIPAALATLPFNLPLLHMAGGDLSQGAIDDRIRHALTKLSHLHCVINVKAAERVRGMGEESWRIHVTGATGLDTLAAVPAVPARDFAAEIGLPTTGGLRLVTVHPETNSDAPRAPLDAVLDALDRAPAPTLITAPNADPGGAEMRRRIEDFVAGRDWAVFHDTLGARRYANALRHATVMVGNSSSGLVEAGMFGLNVIDVGRRQDGRERGANVHDCPNEAGAVAELLARLTEPASGRPSHSIYGDGNAAPRIVAVIDEMPDRRRLLDKRFGDDEGESEAEFLAPWHDHDEKRHAAG